MKHSIGILSAVAVIAILTLTSMKMKQSNNETGAYLEITLKVNNENRASAAGVYVKYKQPFLKKIQGATSKELIMRSEDVQVLHGFESEADAKAYLSTNLFENDVVRALKPYLEGDPEVRIYTVFKN